MEIISGILIILTGKWFNLKGAVRLCIVFSRVLHNLSDLHKPNDIIYGSEARGNKLASFYFVRVAGGTKGSKLMRGVGR